MLYGNQKDGRRAVWLTEGYLQGEYRVR